MPIVLKNRGGLPKGDAETVDVLGLSIPITTDLPFGGQVELMDLQAAFEAEKVGQVEFLMRTFCLFTWRLPKRERVTYEWLSRQQLDADEVTEITAATLQLLNGLKGNEDEDEGEGEGNDPKPAKGKKGKGKKSGS